MLYSMILLLSAAVPPEGPVDCGAFLIGHWTGKGAVEDFAPGTEADSDYRLNEDGSFVTINRIRTRKSDWSEQRMTGRWHADEGSNPGRCVLVLETQEDGVEASSSTEVKVIDGNTYRSFGIDMRRSES
mgnify:CR=1 FL=1